jgi:hypothetical protein
MGHIITLVGIVGQWNKLVTELHEIDFINSLHTVVGIGPNVSSWCCNPMLWEGILPWADCRWSGVYSDKVSWLFIITCWMVTNWSTLETYLQTFSKLMFTQTLNMFIQIKVIWESPTHMKHLYNLTLLHQSAIWINSVLMKLWISWGHTTTLIPLCCYLTSFPSISSVS